MPESDSYRILTIIGAYPDIGKGILTASLGYILQQQGLIPSLLKFDGYLNYNSGSMNPYHSHMNELYEEEEVFVLKDGFEADADSGYYERFLGLELTAEHNMTNGQLFGNLLSRERAGELSPGEIVKFKHLHDMMMKWILVQANRADVIVLEIGGTVGDPESTLLYRALDSILHRHDAQIVTILLSPYFSADSQEPLAKSSRTKISRQAFERAANLGLRPDLIALRCSETSVILPHDKNYISSDCGIRANDVYSVPDCVPVYDLPMKLAEQDAVRRISQLLGLEDSCADSEVEGRLEMYCSMQRESLDGQLVRIGILGRTVSYDTFVSLKEAVKHAAVEEKCSIDIVWLDHYADSLQDMLNMLKRLDGLIVGECLRYWEEAMAALRFSRTNSFPTLSVSFGFDLAAVELAKNVCKNEVALEELSSCESEEKVEVVDLVTGGHYVTVPKGSQLAQLYNSDRVFERYRHKSRLSRSLANLLSKVDELVLGHNDEGHVECLELITHPFYIAMKAHPEFKSWPGKPSPPFLGLIREAKKQKLSDKLYEIPQTGESLC